MDAVASPSMKDRPFGLPPNTKATPEYAPKNINEQSDQVDTWQPVGAAALRVVRAIGRP